MIAIVTTYTLLLAFHIFAAVVWVGGALMLNLLAILALRSELPGRQAEFAHEAEAVGMRLFAPTSLILLGLGFWLIHEGHWQYDLWIVLALIGFGLSFVTGIAFIGPESKRIGKAIQEHGPEAPEVVQRIRRILLVSRIELLILVLLVFDMVLKPGT
jgi:uncharacterized membrane protein